MRNINHDNTIAYENLPKINVPSVKEEQILRKGDLLFRAKGNNNFASYIDRELENTITNSHILIVRIMSDQVMSEYVCWFLNQSKAQHYFFKNSPGTVIPVISGKTLANLNISIPDIKTQEKIIELYKLSIQEQELVRNISKKRKILIDNLLNKKIEDK